MSLEVQATYENGLLKPSRELPLHEGQIVTLTIQSVDSPVKRFCGSLPWTRDPEELRRFLNDPDEYSPSASSRLNFGVGFVAGVGTPTPENRSGHRGRSTDPGHDLQHKIKSNPKI